MLSRLQSHLTSISQVDPGYDVADFLITDPLLAGCLGKGSLLANTEETVLVQEDENGLALSVFLDDELLSRLNDSDPLKKLCVTDLNDLWTVLEGISHFNYIVWNAQKNRQVSLLELEIQAEVDKFTSTLILALHQDDTELADNMHGWLFDNIHFNDDLSQNQRDRYSTANNYAARFCYGFRERIRRNGQNGLRELRQFYRLSQRDKISHIHSAAFAQ
jgi:hypothetical protein